MSVNTVKIREADIQKTIIEGLSALRIWHMRCNSGAMFAEHDGKKRMLRFGRKGMADILAMPKFTKNLDRSCGHPMLNGQIEPELIDRHMRLQVYRCSICGYLEGPPMPLWIEVKQPGKLQSPEQKFFQGEMEAEGHRYIVAHSWEDVCSALQL